MGRKFTLILLAVSLSLAMAACGSDHKNGQLGAQAGYSSDGHCSDALIADNNALAAQATTCIADLNNTGANASGAQIDALIAEVQSLKTNTLAYGQKYKDVVCQTDPKKNDAAKLEPSKQAAEAVAAEDKALDRLNQLKNGNNPNPAALGLNLQEIQ